MKYHNVNIIISITHPPNNLRNEWFCGISYKKQIKLCKDVDWLNNGTTFLMDL